MEKYIYKSLILNITQYNYKYDIDDEPIKINYITFKLYSNIFVNGIFLHNEIINIYNWPCCTSFYYYSINGLCKFTICITSDSLDIFNITTNTLLLDYHLTIRRDLSDVENLPDDIIEKIKSI